MAKQEMIWTRLIVTYLIAVIILGLLWWPLAVVLILSTVGVLSLMGLVLVVLPRIANGLEWGLNTYVRVAEGMIDAWAAPQEDVRGE